MVYFHHMKNRIKTSIIFLSLVCLISPSISLAVTASAEFRPHFLISDEEMQNWQAMNQGDIQAFLDDHKSYISRLQTPDKDGITKTTAQIIQEAAQLYRINPKYLLVKLQKEQSLVTEDNPTQKQLDWATGYGICDACSMDDPKLQKHRGFGTQVDSAAGIIRWYYDNVSKESWIKKPNTAYTIDGQNVVPANYATAFLYTYTPHIQGNQNFWKLWQKWFDQVFPDGTLVKSITNNTIYLIQDGKKRAFTSMAALSSRYNPKLVIPAPESELSRYESAPAIQLPNYSILKQDNNYYLLDFDTLRPFENADVVRKLGYNPDEILTVDSSELVGLSMGSIITADTSSPLGELVRVKETKQLYFIKDGLYHPIMDPSIAKTRFPGLSETSQPIAYLQKFVMGEPILYQDGTMIKIKGFPEVYIIEHGEKRHITYEAFVGWGLSFKNLIEVDEITGIYHPTGQSIFLRDTMAPQITEKPKQTSIPTQSQVSKMVVTPENERTFVGKKFETPIQAYLVGEYDSGNIVAGKNIDFVRPMASFTKVMTGYRLFHEGINLSRSVTYQASEHKSVYHTFRVAEGEQIINKDLMLAMIVSSINTAARMVVDSVEKNERAFVQRMNEHVKTLGLNKTKFVDVTGEDVENKTTPKEYFTIFKNAVENVELRKFLSAESYEYHELLDTDGKPRHFDEHSNLLLQKNNLPFIILGSKTGYLDESGANLAMLIQRKSDNKKFILITMGNPDYTNRFVEPEKIATWAMQNF